MQKNILIAIFVTLFVAILATFVLIFKFDDKQSIVDTFTTQPTPQEVKKQKNEGWTNRLANANKESYYFAVNDLFIEIDLKQKDEKKSFLISYVLVIDNADRYSLFCIKQVLNTFSLPYIVSILKDKKNIVIQSVDRKSLENVANELKKYDIKSKIKEVKNEENSNL